MKRENISSGAVYENIVGYSRAVRIGKQILISGTAPILQDGTTAYPGDLYKQTKKCLEIIEDAIIKAGGKVHDVVRTRVFLVNASDWKAAGKAHGEFFKNIKPCCTFVGINELIKDDWLVEIEADCIMSD